VVDFQRTEGEPLLHLDKDEKYWETGPWGFSTTAIIHAPARLTRRSVNVSALLRSGRNPPRAAAIRLRHRRPGVCLTLAISRGSARTARLLVSNDSGNNWRRIRLVPAVLTIFRYRHGPAMARRRQRSNHAIGRGRCRGQYRLYHSTALDRALDSLARRDQLARPTLRWPGLYECKRGPIPLRPTPEEATAELVFDRGFQPQPLLSMPGREPPSTLLQAM